MKTAHGNGFSVQFDPEKHKYWLLPAGVSVKSEEIPSVTQAIGIIDKSGPLMWWAQRIGVRGVIDLIVNDRWTLEGVVRGDSLDALADEGVALLTSHKITCNHQRDKAGARGTNVHKIAEDFAGGQKLPDPDSLPETERGYVEAFAKFVAEREPKFLRTEVLVAHPEHRYGGTFDFHAIVEDELWLGDFKTSKGVYPESMHVQLEAYDEAAMVMGYVGAEKKVIVHLKPDGEYDLSFSVATFDDFLAYLNAFRAHKGIKQRAAEAKKIAKAQAALRQAA